MSIEESSSDLQSSNTITTLSIGGLFCNVRVGVAEGLLDGFGDVVGLKEGDFVGDFEACTGEFGVATIGEGVGFSICGSVGLSVGEGVRFSVCCRVGLFVGEGVGFSVCCRVGLSVGGEVSVAAGGVGF